MICYEKLPIGSYITVWRRTYLKYVLTSLTKETFTYQKLGKILRYLEFYWRFRENSPVTFEENFRLVPTY